MRAFSINRNRWAQKFLFGALMLALGIVWAQEAFRAKPMQTVEGVFFALFAWYGLMVLSQSFFAEIRTDETGIAIRKTFLPATRIAYDDITGMFYDAMHARMMLVLNGTKRVAFVYQYEDVQGLCINIFMQKMVMSVFQSKCLCVSLVI